MIICTRQKDKSDMKSTAKKPEFISLYGFLKDIPDEVAATDFFEKRRWKDEIAARIARQNQWQKLSTASRCLIVAGRVASISAFAPEPCLQKANFRS